jgi:hypothetical protein
LQRREGIPDTYSRLTEALALSIMKELDNKVGGRRLGRDQDKEENRISLPITQLRSERVGIASTMIISQQRLVFRVLFFLMEKWRQKLR